MPRRKVVEFAESAAVDMEGILDWYRKREVPEVGETLVRGIFGDVARLQDFPKSGRVVPELDIENIRELIRPPFRIVYRIDDARIRIVRVWRSERKLEIPG